MLSSKKKLPNRLAFTLVELLVVVAIIGVMVAFDFLPVRLKTAAPCWNL